jgi:hypothetical protein
VLSLAGCLVKQDFAIDQHFTHQFSRFTRGLRSQKNFATFLLNATAGTDRQWITFGSLTAATFVHRDPN